jgi:23S rRNA (pseudouridine1915-N3)-methyltransferase
MKIALPEITILCVGTIKDPSLSVLSQMYLKRLTHDVRLTVREIRDRRSGEESTQLVTTLKKLNGYTFACSEEGTCTTSAKFARRLGAINRNMVFIIGGPTGLSREVKNASDEVFSLSPMTFTHEMARILLLEQIYRAGSILHNRSYHKE